MRTRVIGCIVGVTLLMASVGAQTAPVRWANERLSVSVTDAALKDLLEEVGRRAGLTVTGADRVTIRRSIEFQDKSLLEGLALLLEGVDYAITEEAGGRRVRILGMSGKGQPLAPATGPIILPGLSDKSSIVELADAGVEIVDDEDEQEELTELSQALAGGGAKAMAGVVAALKSEYSEVRIKALQALGGASADVAVAIPLVSAALADDDTSVSYAASEVLAKFPGPAALNSIAALLTANDVEVQFGALRALALRADLASIPHLRKAAPQLDPMIRGYADTLLQELEERQRARAAAPPKG